MKVPERKRRDPGRIGPVPVGIDLDRVATRATYIGSPVHKDVRSPAGLPESQPDKGICDRGLSSDDFRTVTSWLKMAIRRGDVGAPWEDEFPRYVWHKEGDTVYEARLSNRGAGAYKGYPLEPRQSPRGLR